MSLTVLVVMLWRVEKKKRESGELSLRCVLRSREEGGGRVDVEVSSEDV